MRRAPIPLLLIGMLILLQCDRRDATSPFDYRDDGTAALVMVIENRNWIGYTGIEAAFEAYRATVTPLMADLFGIPAHQMNGLSLTRIVDEFAEPWQIEEIEAVAQPAYNRVIALTDGSATAGALLDTLDVLTAEGYHIDMIWNLHGSSTSVAFWDGSWPIETLTRSMQNRGIRIRALYQTCCHGRDMIDEWEKIRTPAVNGAQGVNSFMITSPAYFLECWISGDTYVQAVQKAYEHEIEFLSAYLEDLPAMGMMFTESIKTSSAQHVGGLDPQIKWDEFPVLSQ